MAPNRWKVTVIDVEDIKLLEAFTIAQYNSFIGTDNKAAEILLPPARDPTPEDIRYSTERNRAAYAKEIDTCEFMIVLDDETGRVAGGAKWSFYGRDPQHPEHVKLEFPGQNENEKALTQRLMDEMQRRRCQNQKGAHAVLDICFTTPEYERQGVATTLVTYGLDCADQNGWKAYVDASPRGRAVYERLGFVVKEDVSLQWGDNAYWKRLRPVVWFAMEREPKKS